MKGSKSSGAGNILYTLAARKTRPASAFFVFMEEFRKQFQEENPNNRSIAAIGKAGGAKWKSMSADEKSPYVAEAEKRKTGYKKNMTTYNKQQAAGGYDEDDDSDKSMSEVTGEEEDSADNHNHMNGYNIISAHKPNRLASPFFVFMEEFKKQFQEENPNIRSIAAVGKAGGAKWKSMSVAEQAPYVAEAEKRTDYEKNMTACTKKQAAGCNVEDDDSDKFKSKVKKEEEDNVDEKAPYVAKAEKRKTEYEKNMTGYIKKQEEDDD